MSLHLGKSFDRCYNIRIPFLDGYYNIGVYFNKHSSFLLFKVDSDFQHNVNKHGVKINMFKNLESSKFCEAFIKLHNYKKSTLDIVNQFESINADFYNDIFLFLNENLNLMKIEIADKELFDTLTIYGFTLNLYSNEFIFIIAERQNIIKKLGRKIVRSSGLQIGTTSSINMINEYYKEVMDHKKINFNDVSDKSNIVLNLTEDKV